jgi:hypothetical protein
MGRLSVALSGLPWMDVDSTQGSAFGSTLGYHPAPLRGFRVRWGGEFGCGSAAVRAGLRPGSSLPKPESQARPK